MTVQHRGWRWYDNGFLWSALAAALILVLAIINDIVNNGCLGVR